MMTLVVKIGRRVPKNWFKRQASKAIGLISFQENLWLMIKQSMNLGKKKCNASGKGEWIMTTKRENESMYYEIEWLDILIRGDREFEKEEHKEALQMYEPFGKIFKKEFKPDPKMKSHFRTKVLSQAKVDEAYKKGYGAVRNNDMASKLLEMGILTHIELLDDYDTREVTIKHTI